MVVKRVSHVRCGLVFLLLLALAPGFGEVVENVLHLLTEGHAAHARSHDDDHAAKGPEHGCTGTFHMCSCHSSSTGLRPAVAPRAQVLEVIATLASTLAGPTDAGFHLLPERPPQA